MPFTPLHDLFPDVAKAETRSVILIEEKDGLPAGTYAFLESYCDDKDCDCRTAFLNVWCEAEERIMATLRYGWEEASFYAKWVGDPELGKVLTGASLEQSQPQSKHANALLELFERLVLTVEYKERIKRHYKLFRAAVDAPPRREIPRPPSRNAPCPCGSGRKYKGCCGRRRQG